MSDLTLVLESARISSGRLELTPVAHPTDPDGAERPTWHASLTAPDDLSVSIVTPEGEEEERTLAEYFAWLFEDKMGFDGAREWGSLYGALHLSAIHDQINSVTMTAKLTGGFYVAQWTVAVPLLMDPGRFHQLSRNAALFVDRFNGVAEDAHH